MIFGFVCLLIEIVLTCVSFKMQNVSAELKAGELTAVMGPSGAGKTSIMRVLSGRSVHSSGIIRVNGCPVPKLGQYRY